MHRFLPQAPKPWSLVISGLSHNVHEVLKILYDNIYEDRKLTKINSNNSLKKTTGDLKRHLQSWVTVSFLTAQKPNKMFLKRHTLLYSHHRSAATRLEMLKKLGLKDVRF